MLLMKTITFALALFSSAFIILIYVKVVMQQAVGEDEIPQYVWTGLKVFSITGIILWSILYYLSHLLQGFQGKLSSDWVWFKPEFPKDIEDIISKEDF